MVIPAGLRLSVFERASGRCEYCQLPQAGQEAVFHVDHVQPRVLGGATDLENLALACVSCSLRKAARRDAPDPETGSPAPIYHPRHDAWHAHFRWEGARIVGTTPTGRATV